MYLLATLPGVAATARRPVVARLGDGDVRRLALRAVALGCLACLVAALLLLLLAAELDLEVARSN